MEWMKRDEFDSLYGSDEDESMKEEASNGHIAHDEWVVALSFARNTGDETYTRPPKGSVVCLPSSTSYKLAVSTALTRWEIEWVSSKWTEGAQSLGRQQALVRED